MSVSLVKLPDYTGKRVSWGGFPATVTHTHYQGDKIDYLTIVFDVDEDDCWGHVDLDGPIGSTYYCNGSCLTIAQRSLDVEFGDLDDWAELL